MRSTLSAFAAALALLVTGWAPAAAQPTTSLSGRVADPDGAPLDGIAVTVFDPQQAEAAATATAADGGWRAEVAEGDYTVRFDDPTGRHQPLWFDGRARAEDADVVTVSAPAGTAGIDATLALRELPVQIVAGPDRVATALAGSRHAFADGAEAVVIASASSFPDALAAAPLAAHEGGPLLLVGRRLGPDVTAELRRLGARRATIVGAVAAVSATVQDELRRAGLEAHRIAGDGRYDTAALIARAVGPADSSEVIVVSGADFADAMSAAPLAAAGGIPILLTMRDALPGDTLAALEELRPQRTLVVGGSDAVSDSVMNQLPDPERIAGRDRHATSVAVASALLARGGSLGEVAVATGLDYPDGLASAPVVARSAGPLLLAHPDPGQAGAVYEFLDRNLGAVGGVTLFGGPAALGPQVRRQLARPYEASE